MYAEKNEWARALSRSPTRAPVLCCELIDDDDGKRKIAIGTYSGDVLVYRCAADGRWELAATRSFGAPVHRLTHCNFLGEVFLFVGVGRRRGVRVDATPTADAGRSARRQLCVQTTDGVVVECAESGVLAAN